MTVETMEEDTTDTDEYANEPVVDEDQAKEAAKFLQQNCYSVSLEVPWFSTSKKLTDDRKKELLGANVEGAAYSMAKQLFDSGHDAIKRLNSAKIALTAYRDSKTIPMAQLPLNGGVLMMLKEQGLVADDSRDASRATQEFLQKEAGVRVIMVADIDEFDNHVRTILIPNLMTALETANNALPEIIEDAKGRLDEKDIDSRDWPEKLIVGVRGPDYRQMGVDVDFEQNCPEAAARLRESGEQWYLDNVKLAVGDFANSFMAACALAAQQLSHRVKLAPPEGEWKYLEGAEVREIFETSDDSSLEEGQISIEVFYLPDGAKKKKTETIGPFTRAQYEALNPMTQDAQRKVFDSTFEKLLNDMARFTEIRNMLGELGGPMDGIVKKVRDMLKAADIESASDATTQVKRSNFFRKTAAGVFADAAGAMESVVEGLPVRKAKRRRAIGKR